MKKWAILLAFLWGGVAFGQALTITGTVKDPTGILYQNGSGRVQLVPTNTQWTVNNGYPVTQTVWVINNLDAFGKFSIQLPSTLSYDQQSSNPQYQFSFCSASYPTFGPICFTMTPLTLTTSQDISVQIQAQSAPLPQPNSAIVLVNGVGILNPNIVNSPCILWTVALTSQISASIAPGCSGGGGGGGSNVTINGIGIATPNFQDTSAFKFALLGNNINGVPVAQGSEGAIQINHLNAFSAVANFGLDSVTSPTTFNNGYILNQQGDAIFKGLNPYIDIRSYGARPVVINTTGTGSGTSLTVGVSTFVNGDGITIANAGAAPAISAPTGLAVATGTASGETTIDVPTIAGMTGSTTYNYLLFAVDVLGGATVPTSPVTITNGPSALGGTPFTVSTWSLTGNTLTIVTSATSNLPVGTHVHIKGTSNNALAGGWYSISGSSGTTLTFNNVPQFSSGTTSGTGGTLTAFVGNALTWTASTGGTLGTTNVVWDYYICSDRGSPGTYHIIGRSFPSTFYQAGIGYSSTRFVDFGSPLAANAIIPWYLSDANCTAGSAQNELFTTTVAGGGGGTSLTLINGITNSVTGALVRQDNAPAISAALSAATNGGGNNGSGSAYIPLSASGTTWVVNSFISVPLSVNMWQAGTLTLNEPILLGGSTNWFGTMGITTSPTFSFSSSPQINCNAWPCVWVAGVANQANGGTVFDNLTLKSAQNGLIFLVDANWGMLWNKVNAQAGTNNNDNMGISMMIRPGAANYTITNSNFVGGPNQVIDQTWAPLFYADQGISGCCSSAGNVGNIEFLNTQWNRRGVYYLANGGDGAHINIHGRLYRQGGITPDVEVQNINGSINGNVTMDYVFHDTESQAAYAQICNIACAPGFGSTAGLAFKLGQLNTVSTDAGTIPSQITGGGNAAIQMVVAAVGPGGLSPNPSVGWYFGGGALYPIGNINMLGANGAQYSFIPNVPTPELTLQNGAFNGNETAPITANRNWQKPDASGVECVTGLLGCDYTLDTGVANAYAICPAPIPVPNLIIGQHFTWQAANQNSGASTLNVCSTGAHTIKKNTGTGGSVGADLVSQDIKVGQFIEVGWDGTNFQFLSQLGNGGGGGGTVATTGSPAVNNLTCFSAALTITNCNLTGDVTTSGTSATTVAKIQTVPVNTSGVQQGQILTVDNTPQYINKFPGVNYNPQTTTYSIACPGDRLGYVDFTGSAATTFTLGQANSTACLGSSASYFVHNGGTAALTLAATTSTIDGIAGATGVQILPGEARLVYEDPGSPNNYHTTHIRSAFGGVNTQTASYTAVASDFGKLIVLNSASACVFTLPATPPITGETTAGTRWNVRVLSIGASLCTVALNGLNFNGSASAPILIKYVEQDFSTDGSNYFGSAPLVASTNVTFTPAPQGLSISATGGGGGGSVTQVNTSGCLSGGPITTTGTVTSNTCDYSASTLTNKSLVIGNDGVRGTATSGCDEGGTTTGVFTCNDAAGANFQGTDISVGTPTPLTWCDGGSPGGSQICAAESTPATDTTAGVERMHASSTQHTWETQVNGADYVRVRGNLCTSVTPVTVAVSTTADQNLISCTLKAGDLNTTLRTLSFRLYGVYSTPAASVANVTVKVKFCTVPGCGSGTVITPLSITSGANPGSVTNNAANLRGDITTQTAGASAAFEAHGSLLIDLGALTTAADSTYADTNTATVGTIDSTGQIFLQTAVAFSVASASNSYTARQLIVDVEN